MINAYPIHSTSGKLIYKEGLRDYDARVDQTIYFYFHTIRSATLQ